MKFPIFVKNKRIFIWYHGHWINIHLESIANGGGFKGYYRFFKGLLLCILGKHRYIFVFSTKDSNSHKNCSYCRKIKNENN